jgi:hypothetical protein
MEQPDIEQVEVSLPYVSVYCKDLSGAKLEKAYLSSHGKESELEDVTDEKTEVCSHYYVVLDLQKTLNETQYKSVIAKKFAKDGAFSKALKNSKSDVKVYVAGGSDTLTSDATVSTTTLENLGEDNQEEFETNLDLRNANLSLKDTISKISNQKNGNERTVLILVSDTDSDDEELETVLKKATFPAYLYRVKDKTQDTEAVSEELQKVIEKTGGEVETKNDIEDLLSNVEAVDDVQKLQFRSTQRTDTKTEYSLVLQWNNGQDSKKSGVKLTQYETDYDEEHNQVKVQVEENDDTSFLLTFDKTVKGADEKENYSIDFASYIEGEEITYSVVNVDNAEEQTDEQTKVKITLNRELEPGNYDISFENITTLYGAESSPEKESCIVQKKQQNNSLLDKTKSLLKKYIWILVGVVILLVFMIALVLIGKKRKKNKRDKTKAVVSPVPVKPPVPPEEEKKDQPIDIQFRVYEEGHSPKIMHEKLDGVLIVGRSEISDVVINAPMLSRQHFYLVREEDKIFIEDLETLNGTKVNEEDLVGRKQLVQSDVIYAGGLKIMIDW